MEGVACTQTRTKSVDYVATWVFDVSQQLTSGRWTVAKRMQCIRPYYCRTVLLVHTVWNRLEPICCQQATDDFQE